MGYIFFLLKIRFARFGSVFYMNKIEEFLMQSFDITCMVLLWIHTWLSMAILSSFRDKKLGDNNYYF